MGRSRALHRHARVPRAPAPAAAHADPHAAGQTPQHVPPQQQLQHQQRPSSTAQAQPAAQHRVFSILNPNTWSDSLRESVNPREVFFNALVERFSAAFFFACTDEEKDAIVERFAFLIGQAMLLLFPVAPAEKWSILMDCTGALLLLVRMDGDARERHPQYRDPHDNSVQPSQRANATQLPPSAPHRAAFRVDDTTTWFEFLRRSSDPSAAFRDALEERFSRVVAAAPTAEHRHRVKNRIYCLHQNAVSLLFIKMPSEKRSVLGDCDTLLSSLLALDELTSEAEERIRDFQANTVPQRSQPAESGLPGGQLQREPARSPAPPSARPAGGGAGGSTFHNAGGHQPRGSSFVDELEEMLWRDMREYVLSGGHPIEWFEQYGFM